MEQIPWRDIPKAIYPGVIHPLQLSGLVWSGLFSRSQGLKVSRSQGLKVSRSQGLKVVRSQVLKVSRSQGHDKWGEEGEWVNGGDRDEGE